MSAGPADDGDAWAQVGAGGLGLPHPPAALAAGIRPLGPDRWGTRERAPGLAGLGWYAREFEEGRAPEYVLAGIEDASTNLPALHYLVVYGRLGLFVQADGRPGRGDETLAGAAHVQQAAVRAAAEGILDAGPECTGRLQVVHSAFGNRWWRWDGRAVVGGDEGLAGAARWLEDRLRARIGGTGAG